MPLNSKNNKPHSKVPDAPKIPKVLVGGNAYKMKETRGVEGFKRDTCNNLTCNRYKSWCTCVCSVEYISACVCWCISCSKCTYQYPFLITKQTTPTRALSTSTSAKTRGHQRRHLPNGRHSSTWMEPCMADWMSWVSRWSDWIPPTRMASFPATPTMRILRTMYPGWPIAPRPPNCVITRPLVMHVSSLNARSKVCSMKPVHRGPRNTATCAPAGPSRGETTHASPIWLCLIPMTILSTSARWSMQWCWAYSTPPSRTITQPIPSPSYGDTCCCGCTHTPRQKKLSATRRSVMSVCCR